MSFKAKQIDIYGSIYPQGQLDENTQVVFNNVWESAATTRTGENSADVKE